ncbi:abscission/NoCut checkpoint regulator [Neocloeon triangulifer]|uniref:abscission/NoCut checkpoint regulator n=1 Tax=Neocloeon triangulifer TaxID=2078957 RepID=UPI00286F1530|nr:abscission/NoCut checkpoint regulator [Neocloeon triangulifer]
MSCSTCSAKFGFMKKEVGCPGCGFSFCSRCLKFEAVGMKSLVCKNCSEKSKNKPLARPPPDIFLKRLENLEDPSRPPVTVYAHQMPAALQNLSQPNKNPAEAPSEIELRGRLQKLRQRLTAAPSVEEIEERLAKLQGMHHAPKHHSFDVSSLPSKSGEEQTRDLIKQMEEEAALKKSYETSWQADIESRLARLKAGSDPLSEDVKMEEEAAAEDPSDPEALIKKIQSEGGAKTEEIDDEEELEIVNKIVAKIALKEKLRVDDSEVSDEEVISDHVSEEVPWCCICNEDATLRCPGCAGDLYCGRCFKEGHDVCDMNEHKPVKYDPPKVEDMI